MLEINEIFGPTIQGEGKLVGNPSIFVRFGNCNMSCEGFGVEYETPSGVKKFSCDSFHASDITFKEQWKTYNFAKDVIKDINKLIPKYLLDIVITGGEPLLYWKNEEFQKLLFHYISEGYNITIETNASLNIEFTHDWQKKILFSMSVKLENSGEKLQKRINIDTIEKIITQNNQSYLKFVVCKNSVKKASMQIDEILNKVSKCEVYLMPLGDTAIDIDKNSLSIINLCLKKGFKYSDRLHIRVWNNKRGV